MDNVHSIAGCHVRPMLGQDLARVLQWRNHPDVRAYMYSQREIASAEHRAWYERCLQNDKLHLLIYEESDTPLGFVKFEEISVGRVAEWGFYASPGAPKGTGQKLGHTALNHAFGVFDFHKVCGQALDFNKRSINFHVKLGFREEGVLRDQYFDGKNYHAVVWFGILAEEWFEQSRDQRS